MTDASLRDVRLGDPRQSVFQPDGATPASGPLIVVGYIGDDEDTPACFGPRRASRTPAGRVARWGDHAMVRTRAGPSSYTYNAAYVFGRDVSDATLRRAAASVDWEPPSAPAVDLPSGFRLRATGQLPAFGGPWIGSMTVGVHTGPFVRISQEAGNPAAVYLARVWKAIGDGHSCHGSTFHTTVRGSTVVRVWASDTQGNRAAVDRVTARLTPVTRARFCATDPAAAEETATACP